MTTSGRNSNSTPFLTRAPDAPGQLYDLDVDPGETTNLYFKHPQVVRELKTMIDRFVDSGRSAPPRHRLTGALRRVRAWLPTISTSTRCR